VKHGRRAGDCGRADAGQRVDVGEEFFVECVELLGLVSGNSGIDGYDQQIGAIEAEVLGVEIVQGSQKEAGDGEQNE
jgi:hypothetical protein